jgi:hypothetical protein
VGKIVGNARKQYHLWPGERGFDAWDVDRLIALSTDLPVRDVPVEEIRELDVDYWFDGSLEVATVRNVVEHVRLMQMVDTSYPIILGADGRVMDGMHRVARAVLEGRRTLPAVRFVVQPDPDYRDCVPGDLPYGEDDP